MRKRLLMTLGFSLAASVTAQAATFTHAPIEPALGLDALTRDVSAVRQAASETKA